MDVSLRLKALGLSEERIAQLVGGGNIGASSAPELFSEAPATSATCATNEDPVQAALLAWATGLVEGTISYAGPLPLTFHESPLVPVQVRDPVDYARHWLRTLAYTSLMVETGGFGRWSTAYWDEVIGRGLGALMAMRLAIEGDGGSWGVGEQ